MQVLLFSPSNPSAVPAAGALLSVTTMDRAAMAATESLYYSTHATPFGEILVVSTAHGICELHFTDAGENLLETLAHKFPKALLKAATLPDHTLAAGWISGNLPSKAVPLHLSGSSFQLQVWQALLEIPAGQTYTYGQLAARLGLSATAARAVGTAVGQNTIAVLIPCHRVVGSTGKLTGFRWGVERKKQLLQAEMNS